MDIAVFGLGYVGAVSSGCLAHDGHRVIGVDASEAKVEMINEGKAPVVEKDLDDMIMAAVKDGRIKATTDHREAIAHADLAIICVGTPSQVNGNLDLKFIRRVCEQIGAALKEKEGFTAVVIRSTVLPGTLRKVVIPVLEEASGKKVGVDFGAGFYPEFLRESTAVEDFYNPPKIVVSASDERTLGLLKEMNANLEPDVIAVPYETAEMVKYADNAWHAVKVAFGNEIGSIAKQVGIDGGQVMDIFCQDRKLNISEKYLRPGFAFGGSCLPKDVRALTYKARSLDLDLPLMNSIMPSNERHIERALRMIMGLNERKVGVLGLSFKAGTDDLRESPVVEIVERLHGKGYEIRIFDRNVNLNRLVGANREYIFNQLPHIANLLTNDPADVVAHGGTMVLGHNDPAFNDIVGTLNGSHNVVDLVRVFAEPQKGESYHGLCW